MYKKRNWTEKREKPREESMKPAPAELNNQTDEPLATFIQKDKTDYCSIRKEKEDFTTDRLEMDKFLTHTLLKLIQKEIIWGILAIQWLGLQVSTAGAQVLTLWLGN